MGGLFGDVFSGPVFFLGAMVFPPFLFPLLFFVIGGSGVLSHGAAFGFLFLLVSIFFSLWTLVHFSEH